MTTTPPLREIQKNYGGKAMVLGIAISLVFFLLGYKAACRGLVLGALFSTINFVLMAHSLHAKVRPDRTRASLSALGNILFRYAFMAITLILAIKLPRFDLLATVAGLFMVQSVILAFADKIRVIERGKRKAEVVFPPEFKSMRFHVSEQSGIWKLDTLPKSP